MRKELEAWQQSVDLEIYIQNKDILSLIHI